MNSAEYVDQKIKEIKESGIPLSDAAWEAAELCIGWPYIFGDRGQYCTPGQRRSVYNSHPDQTALVSKCQVLSGSRSDCSGCKWYPGGKRVRSFDCRGFTYWILLQIYNWKLMGTGCTTQWNNPDNWKAQGEIADGIPQGVIVCVFYYKKKNGKRTKTLQHTGLYYNGETIECSNGVQYSKTLNKKWDCWGVPACVDQDVPVPVPPQPDPQPEPATHPTLRKGDKGPEVKEMQEKLLLHGENLPRYGADGDFGNETQKAVKSFQKKNGLVVDGICGPKTWAKLDEGV